MQEYGCKSGSYNSTVTDKNVTFHAFPTNPEIREKWMRTNPRKDFVHTVRSSLSSLHFQSSYLTDVRSDKNDRRLKTLSQKRQRRQVTEDSVPSIFANVPENLTQPVRTPRSTKKATSDRSVS